MPASESAWPPLETAQSAVIGLVAFIVAIAPLAVPALIVVLVVITLLQDLGEGTLRLESAWRLPGDRASLMALAFVFFAFLSCLWALRPLYSFFSLAQNASVGLGGWYVAWSLGRRLRALSRTRRRRFTRALPIAFVFVGFYFLLDGLSGDGTTLFFARNAPWLFDGFESAIRNDASGVAVGLHDVYFNRTAASLMLLLPALVAAFLFWPVEAWGRPLGVVATLVMAAVCFKSNSATALLAMATGLVFAVLSLWSRHATVRLLQMVFLAVALAAVPLSMLPKTLALDTHPRIPFSFRERVVIWDDLATLALSSPIIGIGVKSTRFLSGRVSEAHRDTPGKPDVRNYWHPHNGYLQIWLELGAIGAFLFATAGTLLLGRLQRLDRAMQPYAIALAAGTLIMIGPGWGLWQPWLIGGAAFGWVALSMLRPEFEVRATDIGQMSRT